MKKTILLLLILFSSNYLFAQKKDSTYKYWITLGYMMNKYVSFNLNYTFSPRDNFYKIGYFVRGGYFFPGIGADGYLYNSIDFSIGKRFQSEWFTAVFFAGPSYLFGEKLISNNNKVNFNTIGLQTDVQLLFRPANEFGIGIGLYGNLNFEKNFAGININFTVGNGK